MLFVDISCLEKKNSTGTPIVLYWHNKNVIKVVICWKAKLVILSLWKEYASPNILKNKYPNNYILPKITRYGYQQLFAHRRSCNENKSHFGWRTEEYMWDLVEEKPGCLLHQSEQCLHSPSTCRLGGPGAGAPWHQWSNYLSQKQHITTQINFNIWCLLIQKLMR